jgi:hypothetical protein
MEKDESNYFPIVGVIVEWFAVSGKTASLLFSVIIISMFEYAFHYLGGDLNRARQKLMQHGYDVTRKLRQPPRKHDGSISTYSDTSNTSAPISAFTSGANSAKQTVGEYAAKVESGLKASPEIIATEYGRAQYAREQMAEKTGDVLQKVGNAIYSGKSESQDWKTDAPEIKEATGFKQSQNQAANVSKLYQDSLKDHAAGKVFNDAPAPPIKRQSVAETINALLDAVKKSGAKTEADIQAAVFDGYSKLFNPADLDDGDLLKVAAKIAGTLRNTTERNTTEHYGTGEPEAFQPVLTRSAKEGGSIPESENFEKMRKVFEENEQLAAGTEALCPVCADPFLKKRSNQRFCCAEHKAHYWKLAKRNGYRGAGTERNT